MGGTLASSCSVERPAKTFTFLKSFFLRTLWQSFPLDFHMKYIKWVLTLFLGPLCLSVMRKPIFSVAA
jgi:hypothetical protein